MSVRKGMPIRIGFVGYSQQEFDKDRAQNIINKIMNLVKSRKPIIVSGLTNIGIPGLVYHAAKSNGFMTVGVACHLAKDYECFPVDNEVLVGKNWGDESETFLDNIDMLIKLGGGKQSEKEFAEFTGPKFEFKL